MPENKEIELRVETARQKDVGRKIARISKPSMKELGINYGDFIEVEGPKGSIILQVWPALRDDEEDIIRVDGYTREAIGVGVGDYVKVRKAKVDKGVKVVLAPTVPMMFDESFAEYVKDQLLYKAVKRGEIVFVFYPLFGEPLRFVVVSTHPTQAVTVEDDTRVEIRKEPVKEGEALARAVPRVTWEDIGDLEEVKERIREIVELPMRHPELFKHLGIEPPKGVLLYGPPGVGKTLLAKALANEIGAYFRAINGPEIMSKFYGESEQKLREIFEEAEKNAPAIIFIDEIDAIAPKREEVTGEVEKRVVAQLLTLMDGLKGRGKIIVIGATNRVDALDPALRRPGRFDREIEIPPPDKRARKAILEVHTRNVPLAQDVNLEEIADITNGFTGADIAALVKEAAMSALRRFLRTEKIDLDKPIPPDLLKRLEVTKADFMDALKIVHPTLMREVLVEVPEVRWDDIGGLEDVKQQLREA
ncbi:MAG: AAA family ATPase, partial [Desulfurococcales archaeon]|nr:AAA family ATPase [Desulfurococcales archaeon]